MADTQKVSATNTTNGPKLFNAVPSVILQAESSTDGEVDITDAELESMTASGFFKIVPAKKPAKA